MGRHGGSESRPQATPAPSAKHPANHSLCAQRPQALHPKDKQWQGRAGQGWPPRQCVQQPLQPPGSTQQSEFPPAARVMVMATRRGSLASPPCLAATGHLGPVASSTWHSSHHRKKKQTITRASEAWPDLSASCWTHTCLSLPKAQSSHWHLHDVLTSGPLHLLFPSLGSWPGQVLLDTDVSAQCHPLKEGVHQYT